MGTGLLVGLLVVFIVYFGTAPPLLAEKTTATATDSTDFVTTGLSFRIGNTRRTMPDSTLVGHIIASDLVDIDEYLAARKEAPTCFQSLMTQYADRQKGLVPEMTSFYESVCPDENSRVGPNTLTRWAELHRILVKRPACLAQLTIAAGVTKEYQALAAVDICPKLVLSEL